MLRLFRRDSAMGVGPRVRGTRLLRIARVLGLAGGLLAAASAHATLVVSQSVSASTIVVGERTRLTITISNNAAQENGAQLVNNLPPQVRLYDPGYPGYVAPASTCAGVALAPAPGAGPGGADVFTASGFSIPAHSAGVDGSCTISFDITSYTGGSTWNNVIAPTDLTPVNAASPAQQSVLVRAILLPAVSKSLGGATLVQGASRTATITFTNPNTAVNIPFTTFTDNLPANLEVLGIVGNSCGSTTSFTSSSVTLTGGAIPAGSPGTCNLQFTIRGVLSPGQASAAGTNAIAAGDIGNTRGLTYPGATTNITVNSPITLSKGFSVTPLTAGADSLLTVRIGNSSGAALTNVSLSDIVGGGWPAALTNSDAIGAANLNGCGAGATLATGVDGGVNKGFVLTGASIPANGECRIQFNVTSNVTGIHANSIPLGAVGNAEGFTSPARSASVDVRNNALTVSKAISPTTVAPGDVATFAVSVTSFSLAAQTSVTFTDTLPAGMVYVDAAGGGMTPTITTLNGGGGSCSFSAPMPAPLSPAPSFTFDFPGAAAGGTTCVVRFTARVPANAAPNTTLTNTSFGAGNGTVSGSSGAVSLTAVNPLVVTKTFDGVVARQRFQGVPSVAQIELTNNNFSALSNVTFTDALPAGLQVANPPNATTTCGGTVAATAGDTSFTLSGGSLPPRAGTSPFAPGQCSVRVNVVGGTVGTHANTIALNAVSATGTVANVPGSTIRNLNATTATLQYLPALTVAKTFLTNPVQAGGTSRVRITLGNTGSGQLTGVAATDPLAGTGLVIANPANATTTCAGPVALNVPAGGDSAALSGATIAGGTTCDFLFDVVATTGTPSVNTLPPGAVTADGGVASTTATTATLNKITSSVSLTKAFSPTAIAGPGSASRLTIRIENTTVNALTDLAVTDNMPTGMLVAVVPNASTTCAGGIVEAVSGTSLVRLNGGNLPGNSTCEVAVDVTSTVVGTLNNTLPAGAVTNTQGATNASPFTANLAALAGLGVDKRFEPTAVAAGQPALLVIRVNNTLSQALTGITATDNLPAGMVVATPANASSTCAGAVITAAGDKVSFTGAELPIGPSSCEVRVNVVVPTSGTYVNTIPGGTVIANGGAVTNPQPGPQATLHVLQPPTIAKAFAQPVVAPSAPNRLTVTISNPNATQALTGVALRDDLPTGLFVAPVPNAATTCAGGTVSAIASATSAQVAGATVPAAGSCTFSFDTVSNIPGLYTNTIPAGALTSNQGVSNPDPATDEMRVLEPPTVIKAFVPPAIAPNGTSRLIITLGNANASAQMLEQTMDDTLPAGVVVAPTPGIGGSCASGSVTAAAGSALVRYADGASIPPGGCTIEVNVTASAAGTYPNLILAGALRTNAGSNPEPAEADLVVSPLGSISGRVYMDANNNGVYDLGEPPLAGQPVSLIRSLDSVVLQKTTTDAGGFYVFSGLADFATLGSDYSVRFLRGGADSLGGGAVTPSPEVNPLSGTFQARLTPGSAAESSIVGGTGAVGTPNNSNVDHVSRRSNIRLDAAGGVVASSIGNNFGELVPSVITGKVYRDQNNNGVANGTEPGIAGAQVTLSGLDDLGQAVTLTATTDADGNYRFENLRPSCAPLSAPGCPGYVVTQGDQPPGTANGIPAAGTVVSLSSGSAIGTAGTASNNAPALSNGAPAYTIPAGTSRIAGIVLPPNASSAGNNFGEIGNDRSIAGRIFIDTNGDGAFNGPDRGVGAGAPGDNNLPQTLTLTGTDLNGNPVSITTTTDTEGNYRFDGVPPGSNYTVTCTTCAPPAGHINSTVPLAWPGSTGGTAGGTQAVPTITGIDLSGPQTESVNNHFTKTLPGSQISGVVYFDPDNSGGLFTADDLPVPGQTIELRDQATGALVATTTSEAGGAYGFTGLPPGTYRVVMPGLPAGTTHGITSAGTLGGAPNGTPTPPGTAPAAIATIVVAADQSTANHNFPLVSDIRVGGRVYEDLDYDGQFGGADTGLPGVTMGLVGTDAFGNPVTRYTTTDAGGQYGFAGLPPGSYTVRQTQPLGYTSVANTHGPVTGGSAGAVGPLGGLVETLELSFNATPGAALAVNFGETQGDGVHGFKSARIVNPPAAVGVSPGAEVVWQIIYKNDTAHPVTMDVRDTLPDDMTRTGAPAITHSGGNGGVFTPNAGFTGTAGGDLLGSAFMPANGGWVAIDVPVLVTAGATTTRFNQATAGGLNIPTDAVDETTPTGGTGQPPAGVIPPGSVPQSPYQTPGLDPTGVPLSDVPASLSGSVWLDGNGDRRFDSGNDKPIADWAVELVDGSGQTVACRAAPPNSANGCVTMPDGRSLFRTGADGGYGVIGLVPGDYRIYFRDPANNVIYGTPQNTGGDANSRLSSARDHLAVTLLPGANVRQQDLPLDPAGVIYDANTRAPIDGSTVQFCGPAGFDPATMLVGGASYTASGGCAQMTTGPNGFYQFLLAPGAPSGEYTLNAAAPGYAPTPIASIPPQPGALTPGGASPLKVQAQAGPPAAGQPTTYYLRMNLAPGMPDVVHNHIPLEQSMGAGLFLQKQADRDVVELGDSVMYTLRVQSPNGAATDVVITDSLPAGLRLIPGTVRQDGVAVADPAGSPGPVLNFAVGAFAANTPVVVTYRVRVGVGAQQGDGINRAVANGLVGGVPASSNRAEARIRISGGVFFQEACVLGKVFMDCNRNRIQDAEEVGIPGVRFYLQDGTHLVSDSEGKYSICGLPARTSVIRVDTTTLPAGSQLVTSSNRNALDAGSLFLDLKFGELHRADFIEGSCSPAVLEQVETRRRAGQIVAPMVDPPAPPTPRVFRSGPSPAGKGGAQ